MEPLTLMAIAAAAAGGYGAYKSGQEGRKASEAQTKTSAKEQKRQTLADLLDKALQRRYTANKDARLTQAGLSEQKQKALMEMVAGFRDSFR